MSAIARSRGALLEKEKGNECFRAKEYADSVVFYTRSLEAVDKDAKVYANRALSYIKLGQLDKAEADSNNAIKLEPQFIKVCELALGSLVSIFDYQFSIKILILLINSSQGHWRLGQVFMERLQFTKAINAFQRALQLEPTNKELWAAVRKGEKELNRTDPSLEFAPLSPEEVKAGMPLKFSDSYRAPAAAAAPSVLHAGPMKRMAVVEEIDSDDDKEPNQEEKEVCVCACVCLCACACVCVCVCLCVFMCVCDICICIYVAFCLLPHRSRSIFMSVLCLAVFLTFLHSVFYHVLFQFAEQAGSQYPAYEATRSC
jgi:tetratricopeptide (TPR) repeat protein